MPQDPVPERQSLSQQAVRRQLDVIADEISQAPGMYDELFRQLFSQRVQNWMRRVSSTEAVVIRGVAENDPDYLADAVAPEPVASEPGALGPVVPAAIVSAGRAPLFNPDWDFDY